MQPLASLPTYNTSSGKINDDQSVQVSGDGAGSQSCYGDCERITLLQNTNVEGSVENELCTNGSIYNCASDTDGVS